MKMKFAEGEFQEGYPIEIETNYVLDAFQLTPCRHCIEGICPTVVTVQNEGGYNCTTTCIQCIKEALEEVMRTEAQKPS